MNIPPSLIIYVKTHAQEERRSRPGPILGQKKYDSMAENVTISDTI